MCSVVLIVRANYSNMRLCEQYRIVRLLCEKY